MILSKSSARIRRCAAGRRGFPERRPLEFAERRNTIRSHFDRHIHDVVALSGHGDRFDGQTVLAHVRKRIIRAIHGMNDQRARKERRRLRAAADRAPQDRLRFRRKIRRRCRRPNETRQDCACLRRARPFPRVARSRRKFNRRSLHRGRDALWQPLPARARRRVPRTTRATKDSLRVS